MKVVTRKRADTPVEETEPDAGLGRLAVDRGLSARMLNEYGVRYEDGDEFPIVIPYPNMGGVWYERRRRAIGDKRTPKYMSPKGAKPHLYNPLLLGPNADTVWFTEGEFDALALISIGLPAVGVAGVNAFDKRWAHLFWYATVIVAFDGDDAGRTHAAKVASCFDQSRVHVFDTPDGKDLSDMLLEQTLLKSVEAFEVGQGV